MGIDELAQLNRLVFALQRIARGRNCKGPLAGDFAQEIAKNALKREGWDWVGHYWDYSSAAHAEQSGDRTDDSTHATDA